MSNKPVDLFLLRSELVTAKQNYSFALISFMEKILEGLEKTKDEPTKNKLRELYIASSNENKALIRDMERLLKKPVPTLVVIK